jgi:putative membrane protein
MDKTASGYGERPDSVTARRVETNVSLTPAHGNFAEIFLATCRAPEKSVSGRNSETVCRDLRRPGHPARRRYACGMKLIIKWILLASALVLLAQLNIGLQVTSFTSALWAAFVIGLLNAFVRPLLILLTLPVTVMTLGLFLFVVNGLMLLAASRLLEGFQVDGFWPAVIGAVLYSLWGVIIDAALERMMGKKVGAPPPGPR